MAFSGCTSLSEIVFGENLQSIETFAFARCSSLISICLPDSLTSLAFGAFGGCKNLESIYIPIGVVEIWKDTFANCGALKDVYYAGSEEDWNAIDIAENNENLTNATIHYNQSSSNNKDGEVNFPFIPIE